MRLSGLTRRRRSRPATRESAPTEGPLPPASPLPQVLAMPGAPRPRGTMHDSVRTMPAPAAERPERVSLPNYHRYGLAPVLEARREAEAAREATYQEGLARARERIEERMAERERVREAINRREREKQVRCATISPALLLSHGHCSLSCND